MSEWERQAVVDRILADPSGCDLKLSLFVSSLVYKFDSRCVPFPSFHLINGQKNLDGVAEIVQKIPRLADFCKEIASADVQIVKLLHWLLLEVNGPTLETLDRAEHYGVLEMVAMEGPVTRPTHIFKVAYREDSPSELKFQEYAKEFGTAFAFHGTKIFNFHNIVHHGLQQHLNKNALFGEGLYLSSELNVSLPYSSNGTGWKLSEIGPTMSCVALCEYVEHPSYTKKCTNAVSRQTDHQHRLPDKYLLIRNNEVVRVRYLLVYASAGPGGTKPDTLAALVLNHKFLAFFYFVLLVVIGISDSRYVQYLRQNLSRKIYAGIESIRLLFGR